MVVIESKRYAVTSKSSHIVSADVPSGITVEALLRVIVNRKRDNYTFDPVGEGC